MNSIMLFVIVSVLGLTAGLPIDTSSPAQPNPTNDVARLKSMYMYTIPQDAYPSPGTDNVGTAYYVPDKRNVDQKKAGAIVTRAEVLYEPNRSAVHNGECFCPRMRHPSSVKFVDKAMLYVDVETGAECGPDGGANCIPIGYTVDGRVCGDFVVVINETTYCGVETFVSSSNEIYRSLARTHSPDCFCVKSEGAVLGASYVGKIVGDYYNSVSMLAFNKDEKPSFSAPVMCVGSSPLANTVGTRMTADHKYAILDLTFVPGSVNSIKGTCFAYETMPDNMFYIGNFFISQHKDKVCNCSGHSVAESYPLLKNVMPQCTANGDCICQPGWHGPNCEVCLAEESPFGCHHTNGIIWVAVGLTILSVLLTIVGVVFFTGKRAYNKLKGE